MIGKNDVKSIERVESFLALIKEEGDSIFKIITIVQNNQEFFDAKIGGSCLKAAVEKLERLVEAWGQL